MDDQRWCRFLGQFLGVYYSVDPLPSSIGSLAGLCLVWLLFFSTTLLVPASGTVRHVAKTHAVSPLLKRTNVEGRFKCNGKIYCSEMTSCAEAKF